MGVFKQVLPYPQTRLKDKKGRDQIFKNYFSKGPEIKNTQDRLTVLGILTHQYLHNSKIGMMLALKVNSECEPFDDDFFHRRFSAKIPSKYQLS